MPCFRTCVLTAALLAAPTSGFGQTAAKPTKIWNLTASAIVDLRLAPGGTDKFGRNLALDDKDKAIDADERLTLHDVKAGVYDARVKLKNGRACVVSGLRIEPGAIASIEEKDLSACAP